jgi:type IV secretory pathway VirB10-like protein
MKLVGILSTAVLSLTLGVGVPAYAQQDQQDKQEDKDKPAEKDKKAQPAKPAKPDNNNAKPEEKKPEPRNAQQENTRPEEKNARQENAKPEEKNAQEQRNQPEEKNAQQRTPQGTAEQHAGGGRIPDDRFKANFGREHSFRVSAGDYQNHRFQYGGYWFGFASAWPSNWLYTQDVYVVEIDGVYYLCNANYPGVNLTLNVTL